MWMDDVIDPRDTFSPCENPLFTTRRRPGGMGFRPGEAAAKKKAAKKSSAKPRKGKPKPKMKGKRCERRN